MRPLAACAWSFAIGAASHAVAVARPDILWLTFLGGVGATLLVGLVLKNSVGSSTPA